MNNKLKVFLFFGTVLLLFFIISQCGSKRQSFSVSVIQNSYTDSTIDKINDQNLNVNIYLDASIGMKGYFNKDNYADSGFVLKSLLPNIIVDFQQNNYEVTTFAIHDNIIPLAKNEFVAGLKNKSLFYGGNDLKKYLPEIVSDTSNALKIIVSDFIYDNVKAENISVLHDAHSAIYEALRKSDKSILLLQYYSTFDADYYYNMKTWQRPFLGRNLVLNHRPFYLLIVGNPVEIERLLPMSFAKSYNNAFLYADHYKCLNDWSLLQSHKKGKVAISKKSSEIVVYKADKMETFSFLIGHDINKNSFGFNSDKYLTEQTYLKQSYLNDNIKLAWYQNDMFLSKTESKGISSKDFLSLKKELNQFSHVLEVNVLDFASIPNDTTITLSVQADQPSWISDAHLNSDLDIDESNYRELEYKTPLFNVLSGALKSRYFDKEMILFQIHITNNDLKKH